jgi:hypothetical protein
MKYLVVALVVLGLSCSAAQQQIWASGGKAAAACLAKCGVSAGEAAIAQYAGGLSVDAASVGLTALPCVLDCLVTVGTVTIGGALAASGEDREYGSTAGLKIIVTRN